MIPALVSLKSLIKNKSYHIDLPFFRLHYQATVCLLLAFCLMLTAKVLFGDTIDCEHRNEIRNNFLDNMCYSIGTYTRFRFKTERETSLLDSSIPNVTVKVDPQSRYLYPGIMFGDPSENDPKIKVMWHTYYQYVPVILFVQSVLFYAPHYLWKVWENGVISSICKRLHDNRFAPSEYLDSNYELVYFLQNCFKLNRSLVYKYFFCHVLCLLNLIVQIIALNVILNYQFITYGYKAFKFFFFDDDTYGLKLAQEGTGFRTRERNLNSPMNFVFPKVTSCILEKGSVAGGQPNKLDLLCVLPLNILHDKFFLIVWFWFAILTVLTILQIIYDSMYTALPFFRKHLFTKRYGANLWDSDDRRSSPLPEIFLLDLIGHNTDKFTFSALLRKLDKDDWTASPSENQSIV